MQSMVIILCKMKHHSGEGMWEPHYRTKTLNWVLKDFFLFPWLKEKFEPGSPSVREITSNERASSAMADSSQSCLKWKILPHALILGFFQIQGKTENNTKQLTQLIFLIRHCPQFIFMFLYSRNVPALIRFPQDILHMNVNHSIVLESPGKSFPWRDCCAPEGTERMGTLSGHV